MYQVLYNRKHRVMISPQSEGPYEAMAFSSSADGSPGGSPTPAQSHSVELQYYQDPRYFTLRLEETCCTPTVGCAVKSWYHNI